MVRGGGWTLLCVVLLMLGIIRNVWAEGQKEDMSLDAFPEKYSIVVDVHDLQNRLKTIDEPVDVE